MSDDELVGKEIAGCRVERRLGQGGMATVYLATQLDLERKVALKVLSDRLSNTPEQVEQFLQEAKLLARLDHPHIVGIYGISREAEAPVLVMQLVTGGSLKDLLRERKRLPEAEALEFALHMARGLLEAHRQGIIHRDVKPDNILVADGPTLRITDFGIALIADDPTVAFTDTKVAGTPHYMAPEQIDAESLDLRVDVYALGATLYHMATGRPPFVGETAMEILLQHIRDDPTPPRQHVPELSEPFERLLLHMLAKEPEDRPATMQAVIEALESVQGGKAHAAPPAPTTKTEFATPSLLLHEGELPSLSSGQRVSAPPPPWLGKAWIAVLSAACLLLGLGLRPLLAVTREEATQLDSNEELAAVAAKRLERLEASLRNASSERALAAYRAFAEEHPGLPAGRRAEQLAQELSQATARNTLDALEVALIQSQRLEADDDLGPALDALDTLSDAALEVDTEGRIAARREALVAALRARGVAWVPPGDLPNQFGLQRHTGGFYVDLHEVTVGEILAWSEAAGASTPEAWAGAPLDPDLPATDVTIAEAEAFALGRGGRLPTEVEWERAARGPAHSPWPWGEDPPGDRCNWGLGTSLRPPGSFPRDVSAYGCADMGGNVAELTTGRGHRPGAPEPRIKGGSVRTRNATGTRSDFAQEFAPDEPHHHPAIGFRCAYDRAPEAP